MDSHHVSTKNNIAKRHVEHVLCIYLLQTKHFSKPFGDHSMYKTGFLVEFSAGFFVEFMTIQ